MEFEVSGGGTLEVSGDIEVTIPDYMAMLVQSELDEVSCFGVLERSQVIIAAGRKPKTNDIVILTGDNMFMTLDCHQLPYGVRYANDIVPTDSGRTLIAFDAIVDKSNRQMAIDSRWVIEQAKKIGDVLAYLHA